jgi:hypothetical protein
MPSYSFKCTGTALPIICSSGTLIALAVHDNRAQTNIHAVFLSEAVVYTIPLLKLLARSNYIWVAAVATYFLSEFDQISVMRVAYSALLIELYFYIT